MIKKKKMPFVVLNGKVITMSQRTSAEDFPYAVCGCNVNKKITRLQILLSLCNFAAKKKRRV